MEERRVRELRLRLGLSQERFARLLSVSLQTVRRWESGLTKPLPIISLRLDELERETRRMQRSAGGTAMREEKKVGEVGVDLGLGGLFKGIGNLIDLVTRLAEEGTEEYSRSGEVTTPGSAVKGVYGFSIRMGLAGKPVVESFGNIRQTERGAEVVATREPLVDVLDEGDYLVLIAEMPGVEEQDIRLEVEGDILEIDVATRDRRYHKEVLLPSAVDPQSLRSSYRNGVLEIRLAKQ